MGLTGPHWVLLGLTGPNSALMGLTQPYLALLSLTKPYSALLSLVFNLLTDWLMNGHYNLYDWSRSQKWLLLCRGVILQKKILAKPEVHQICLGMWMERAQLILNGAVWRWHLSSKSCVPFCSDLISCNFKLVETLRGVLWVRNYSRRVFTTNFFIILDQSCQKLTDKESAKC